MRFITLPFLICFLFVNLVYCLDKEKDCKCRSTTFNRIIGGNQVPKFSYQWQVALVVDYGPIPSPFRKILSERSKIDNFFCGGSIINEYWILTAAHCIPSNEITFLVGYGSNDLVEIFDQKKYLNVEKAIIHPDYKPENFPINDIALIKVKEPLNFSLMDVQPACFSDLPVNKYSGALSITGWGSIKAVLKDIRTGELEMPVISRFLKEGVAFDKTDSLEFCRNKNQNICVIDEKSKDSACKGDSGGPLHQTKNGRTKVIGVASFVDLELVSFSEVKICAGTTAYVRLSNHLKWIKKIVGDYCI